MLTHDDVCLGCVCAWGVFSHRMTWSRLLPPSRLLACDFAALTGVSFPLENETRICNLTSLDPNQEASQHGTAIPVSQLSIRWRGVEYLPSSQGWQQRAAILDTMPGAHNVFTRTPNGMMQHCTSLAYLLGLLAMIKCSICSYQCDN